MRIGIDLGGTKIEAIALDRSGEVVYRQRVPTPSGDYWGTIRQVQALVANLESEVGQKGLPIGMGIPGTVSSATGLVKNANSVCLIGKPLDRDLSEALGRPVRLANDANCFALSEASDGAAAGASVVFGVILGTGVGGGIVVEGKVLVGPNSIAGEWGHNPLPWPLDVERPGEDCYCGRKGCIEAFLSGPALARDHLFHTREKLTADQIANRAAMHETLAVATMQRFEERLARALASVMNILDPDVIVLGGGLSNIDHIYDAVPRLWGRFVFSDSVVTRLVRAKHGDSSGVRGAAWLWPA